MPGANPAAASSTSSVMETLVAKAPGEHEDGEIVHGLKRLINV
jgi:hypothetical protein